MAGPAGIGEQRYVKPGEWMDYTIYFENETNATAAAQEIVVTLPKDAGLDWTTLELGEVAFGEHIDNGLAEKGGFSTAYRLPGEDGEVRTSVTVTDDTVTWYLRSWDASTPDHFPEDVMKGILLPNDETGRGEGHLRYRVKVRDDAAAGSVVRASATIVFDTNDPIETDPAWWNTVAPSAWEVGFAEEEIAVDEGGAAEVRVMGGSPDAASSVKVYLTYNTATAADVDLANGTVRRVEGNAHPALSSASPTSLRSGDTYQTGLKFPLTLKWDAGEVGEKVLTIPVKADALVEGEEIFTLQLAGASGVELGEERICTVRIADAQWREGMTPEETAAWAKAALPAGAVLFEGGYYALDKKKANATAKALPGWKFVGWVYDSNGKTYSTKATITEKLRKSKKVHPKFVRVAYVRALVDDPATGTVKGGANVQIGKTATLTATPKKGYAFTGWRSPDPQSNAIDGNRMLSLSTTYKYTVGEDGGTLVATFKKESELARPVLTLDDGATAVATDAANGNATNFLSVGVAYSATLKVAGESKVSITKVTGLPKGLAYKGGKISGVPTAKANATVAVTVALASNAKKTWTYKLPFSVAALPEWARGQFAGTVALGRAASPLAADDDESRRVEGNAPYQASSTLTVGTTGKVSGKFSLGGTNWTFAASSFTRDSVVTGEVVRFVVRTTAKGTWKVKSGKKTVTKSVSAPFGFALVADPETSEIAAKSVDGYFGAATDEAEAGAVEFRRNAGVRVTRTGETAGGSVSLSVALGQAASNKTVKATATLKSGYAFTGWYAVANEKWQMENEKLAEPLSLSLSYTVKMAGEDVFLVAAFKKEADLARPVLTLDDGIEAFASAASGGIADSNLVVGVSYPATLKASGEAAVTITKVAGLPAGLKYAGGKLSGVPTAKKAYTATVTVALATNKKKTWTYKPKFTVGALPAWATGSFYGGGDDCYATFSVSSAGKTSGKALFANDTWTFAASSLTRNLVGRDAPIAPSADESRRVEGNAPYRIKATRTNAKKKTATVYFGLTPLADGRGRIESEDGAIAAEKSVWASSDEWRELAASLVGVTLEDADIAEVLDANGEDARSEAEPLTVVFKANGVAAVTDGYCTASAVATVADAGANEKWQMENEKLEDALVVELRVVLPAQVKSGKTIRKPAFRLLRFALPAAR